jgi:hypothetical protein
MEYFAELSVAYHWKKDDVTEYNKWWPHNYSQLIQHDKDTCTMLDEIWKE